MIIIRVIVILLVILSWGVVYLFKKITWQLPGKSHLCLVIGVRCHVSPVNETFFKVNQQVSELCVSVGNLSTHLPLYGISGCILGS